MKKRVITFSLSAICLGIVLGTVIGLRADRAEAGFDDAALAAHIVELADIPVGVCSVLGCNDIELGLEIARSGVFLVHVLDPDNAAVDDARTMADAEGLHGNGIVVEKSSLEQLPYADNMVDLIVATGMTNKNLRDISVSEIVRVLRPEGKAVLGCRARNEAVGSALSSRRLRRWIGRRNARNTEFIEDEFGMWAVVTKPAPESFDDWSHWEHGPDNNPVSTDAVIKAPYMTQYLAEPLYIAMPDTMTAAGGRTFLAMGHIAHHKREEQWLNTLMAFNGYNGIELWRRKLPDGYLVHRSAFIATDDTFYMIDMDGAGVLLLDPDAGGERAIQLPQIKGEWKWIAIKNGVLYALVGKEKDPAETTVVRSPFSHWSWGELSPGYYTKRIPWGFGTTMLACDLAGKKVLWTHKEEAPVDSRGMVVGGGKLFFYGPDSHIGCLDAKSGTLVWANDDPETRELVEEPGRGLVSTPGFKTTVFSLYTPDALFYQAQTRMNVVAVSTKDGSMLWHRKKTSNNPNMLYVDGDLLVGIGPGGNVLRINPLTGETLEDLGFKKRSCVRVTATPDSYFCRGWPEGLTRYDRNAKKVLFNGALRPSCNDGAIPANGLLYVGPWLCDCNLQLMGRIALCSAGDFEFERKPSETERLELADGDITDVEPLDVSGEDWPVYRGSNAHDGSTTVSVSKRTSKLWELSPQSAYAPTAPTAAGGLIFLGAEDGKVRAIDAADGTERWSFTTAGPIMQPPTIWNGRAYVGSGDGYIYALEAKTGRLLWRLRAAPVERRIMAYGSLCSTWPVNTGVLVEDGVAYAGAGIIDYDGTYVYALDAVTGKIKWCNNSSGHLSKELRKGVSAQGDLTIAQDKLWMAGGNVLSPAPYDLETGEYTGAMPKDGSPQANRGEEVCALTENYLLFGGRLRYSAAKNVVNPGSFWIAGQKPGDGGHTSVQVGVGKVPPAWDAERFVSVFGPGTQPSCYDTRKTVELLDSGGGKRLPSRLWEATALAESDTTTLAVAGDVILAVTEKPGRRRLQSNWTVSALDRDDGTLIWQHGLPSPVIPGGLLVNGNGQVIVVMEDGRVACFGGESFVQARISAAIDMANQGPESKRQAVRSLEETMRVAQNPDTLDGLLANLAELGVDVGRDTKGNGFIIRWNLLGPVPLVSERKELERQLVAEEAVDLSKPRKVGDRTLLWRGHITQNPGGGVNLASLFPPLPNSIAYAYTEIDLPQAQDLVLKLGSVWGYTCWVNGKKVGAFEGAPRHLRVDRESFSVEARKGINTILLRVDRLHPASAFSVRLTDSEDNPIDLASAGD